MMYILPIALLALTAKQQDAPKISSVGGTGQVVVTASLPAGAGELKTGDIAASVGEQWLQLVLLSADGQREGPPVLGSYTFGDGQLEFRPRFPLSPGKTYRAKRIFNDDTLATDYRVPKHKSTSHTEVSAVYPTGDALPANLLKFYLYFSAPMREGKAIFEQVHLFDAQGRELEAPWRRQELWTDDARRLTLFIHPGRIKQGVNLREELGPVLEPGREYTLVIDASLLDAAGKPLKSPHRKQFRTLPEVRGRPLPAEWKLKPPPIDTRAPLLVEFSTPMDHALVARYVQVRDGAGRVVVGSGHLGPGERSWSFTPAEPWQDQAYRLHADNYLEDLAGNTPARVFDTDLSAPRPETPALTVSFRPLAATPP